LLLARSAAQPRPPPCHYRLPQLLPPPAYDCYHAVCSHPAALIPQEAVARLPISSLTTSSCLSIHRPRTFQLCVGSTLSPHCTNGVSAGGRAARKGRE